MLLAFNNRLNALCAHHVCYFHFPHHVLEIQHESILKDAMLFIIYENTGNEI